MKARGFAIAMIVLIVCGLGGVTATVIAATKVLGPRPPAAAHQAAAPPADPSVTPGATPVATPAAAPGPAVPSPAGIAVLADQAWVARVSERSRIPARALAAYAGAAIEVQRSQQCAVGWNTLAAIGLVESEHGSYQGSRLDPDGVVRPAIIGIPLDGAGVARIADTDGGRLDGDPRWDRAVGPMQFIPQSWAQWGTDGNGDGLADPHQIDDAALSAARYLCQAAGSLTSQEAWIAAISSYNRSEEYRQRIAAAAEGYAAAGG